MCTFANTLSLISKIQKLLIANELDGWLFFDFHGSNPLGRKLLKFSEEQLLTRRLFYWIPRVGDPEKIVHKIEEEHLELIPGIVHSYISSKELNVCLEQVLRNAKIVAMEYSPYGAIPRISLIDAGTFEMVSSKKVKIVSSENLLLPLTSILSLEEQASHKEAAVVVNNAVSQAWKLISEKKGNITDYDVQQFILSFFSEKGFVAESPPICAINEDAALPHFAPKKEKARKMGVQDFVLIDLSCKKKGANQIYADITRVGMIGKPTRRHLEIFEIVKTAQKRAIDFLHNEKNVTGAMIDDICRSYIEKKGFGSYFTHRTGHSIDTEIHGLGPNIDNFETEDHRPILPGMCFSIEPGIYLPREFGVRLETDVLIGLDGKIEVTGGFQERIESL